MLKNQKRRSDLNYRLSKQIDQTGARDLSPSKRESVLDGLHNTYTNRDNIHENLSAYRKNLLPEESQTSEL